MKYKLMPYPSSLTEGEGVYKKEIIYVSEREEKLYDTIARVFSGNKNKESTLKLTFSDLLPEEYVLKITPENIEILAKDEKGHFYGAMTLLQLKRQFGKKIPCLTIKDRPASAHRGIQINYGQANVAWNRAWVIRFIKKIAEWKINFLYLYFEWNYSFESVGGMSSPFYANRSEIEEILKVADAYNVTVVPQFNFLGHSSLFFTKEKFARMAEQPLKNNPDVDCSSICASEEEALTLFETLIDEICEVFPSPIIQIGGDEVGSIGQCNDCEEKRQKIGKLGIYLNHFKRLNERLKACGKKMGLWGDMILMLCPGSPFWENKDTEPQFKDSNIALLQELRDNLIVYDWWYFGGSKISLDFFREQGIQTVASSSTNGCYCSCANLGQLDNVYKFFEYSQKIDCYGTLMCDWINQVGVHAEHMMILFAAAAVMSWSGCQGDFIADVSREEFFKIYCETEYNTEKMAEYIRFTGSFESALLAPFAVNHRGVALRRFVFHYDNPLDMYFNLYPAFSKEGAFDTYKEQVAQLEILWKQIEKKLQGKYHKLMCLPYLLHTTIRDYYIIMDDIYESYHQASLYQYESELLFNEKLEYCNKKILQLNDVYEKVLNYARKEFKYTGNDYASIVRLHALKKNIKRFADFLLHLKNGHRALPSFKNIKSCLFSNIAVSSWNYSELDCLTEK